MTTKAKNNSAQIQQSIQAIIHINEREKINIRINQERYTKKLREYNKLLGKPSSPSKEQRLSMMKQKMEEIKNRQIFSPNYGKKIRISSPEEEIKSLKKCASMNEIKLNSIKSEVNKQSLENDRILREINLIRRDKLIQKNKLQKITEENDDIDQQIKVLKQKNKRSLSKLNYAGLQKARDENKILENNFKNNREHLEYKYHQVIQDNIRREKNKINELGKQRMANAVFADNARKNNGKEVNSIMITDRDEIQDRIPILDGLLGKWNHTIKYKKQMINKYIANSAKIKDTLDKLLLVLGLENYEDLPQVYEMEEAQNPQVYEMEEAQNAKIDEALSKVSNEVDLLREQKELMEKKISKLQNTKKETNNQNEMNLKEKEINIENLKRLNEDLLNQINRKKTLFNDMEECTFNFLNKMENTYLSDFVVKKMNIEENSKLNETNVLDYLGSVYCYIQLINDFNENVQAKKEIKQNINMSSLANKSIENLDKEIKFKLSKFNYNNCLSKVKKDAKQKNTFDDVIRRLANEIVKDVNGNYDMNEDSSKFGTNVSSTIKNKKKQNIRYPEN